VVTVAELELLEYSVTATAFRLRGLLLRPI